MKLKYLYLPYMLEDKNLDAFLNIFDGFRLLLYISFGF